MTEFQMPLFIDGKPTYNPCACPICGSYVLTITSARPANNGRHDVTLQPCDHIVTLPDPLPITLS